MVLQQDLSWKAQLIQYDLAWPKASNKKNGGSVLIFPPFSWPLIWYTLYLFLCPHIEATFSQTKGQLHLHTAFSNYGVTQIIVWNRGSSQSLKGKWVISENVHIYIYTTGGFLEFCWQQGFFKLYVRRQILKRDKFLVSLIVWQERWCALFGYYVPAIGRAKVQVTGHKIVCWQQVFSVRVTRTSV